MPLLHVQVPPAAAVFEAGFERIRRELEVPDGFPEAVAACAQAAARAGPRPAAGTGHEARLDHRALPLVTIDPPGSRDLDQAFGAERRGGGYRVLYAIADVAAFVAPGDPVDLEARARGVTLYAPDRRTPLHPEPLGEGAASLLPGQDTPALLWTLDLDATGALVDARLERSQVRSRQALSYRAVQSALDTGRADEPFVLLREIGTLRREREQERGGVSLGLPSQEVVQQDGGYALRFERPVAIEGWNAQISLLAGMAAARIMLDAGVGLLRTLPPPRSEALGELRLAARALGVAWPAERSYADFVRGLDATRPAQAVLLAQAARALRGASYLAFDGERPAQPEHSAVAAAYAHVTAPLRRLGDRFANELVLAACGGRRPPGWVLEALPELPRQLVDSRRRARRLEAAVVDLVEALVLSHRVGESFPALVTRLDSRRATVQLRDPAVRARLDTRDAEGGPPLRLGAELHLRLLEADASTRRLRFTRVG